MSTFREIIGLAERVKNWTPLSKRYNYLHGAFEGKVDKSRISLSVKRYYEDHGYPGSYSASYECRVSVSDSKGSINGEIEDILHYRDYNDSAFAELMHFACFTNKIKSRKRK